MLRSWSFGSSATQRESRRTKHGYRGRHGNRCRLEVETLEQRLAPAVFNVTTTADGLGAGTLRAASIAANATAEHDFIRMGPGVYTLTLAGAGENLAATGDLDITNNVTIIGAGFTNTIIDASALGDRAFHVLGVNAKFWGVTIQGGTAEQGGGISNNGGNLSLIHCRLRNNIAQGITGDGQGGGVYQKDGTLNVKWSLFVNNRAIGAAMSGVSDGGEGEGGGIFNEDGRVNVHFSAFLRNKAIGGQGGSGIASGGDGIGGGIANVDGHVFVSFSLFKGNEAIGGRGGDGEDFEEEVIVPGTGGDGLGGAINSQTNGHRKVLTSALLHNRALGGAGRRRRQWSRRGRRRRRFRSRRRHPQCLWLVPGGQGVNAHGKRGRRR
ncbi:MAG: hypothetical protein FJ271_21330 [Planctomycetes bacterium]|nr:hypothetical protein [Planctomycetota bacterium]